LNRRLDILTVKSRLDRPTRASWKAMKTQADGILARHRSLLSLSWYITSMAYEVEVSDEFKAWYENLSEPEQNSVERVVLMLMEAGPSLGYPQSTGIKDSKFSHMRELRIQHEGRPYRVLYAFDPIRVALLLLGGDKTGDERWYEKMVPKADAIYEEHLRTIKK
jgi:hypothetical protein